MEYKKYSVIVFDLGNVLLPFDYKFMTDKLDLVKPGLGSSFREYYKNNYTIHRSFERGDIKEDEFIKLMLGCCEQLIDKPAFCQYYSEIFTENKNVIALLPELKKKYKLVILSNTNNIHFEFGYKHKDFLKNFDKLILSYEAGALKPEPAIYKAVENYTGLPPAEHIFIDDIEEYAEGARAMGWDAIQFKSFEQLAGDLKILGIL
ncbi:MAG: HAD family phosphatase [Ignavibacteria bacterium]